jgi:uncharacterized membrane protein
MLQKLPPWLRSAVVTGGQSFIAVFIVALVGLLNAVLGWLNDSGDPPDLGLFALTVLSAGIAFVIGVLTAIHRSVFPPQNTYPEPPTTTP